MMRIKFFPGFLFMDYGDFPYFVINVHSTSSLNILPRGDVGADLIARLVAENLKCKALISTVTKNEFFGINFNRFPPSINDAKEMFKLRMKKNYERLYELSKHFAFAAFDKKDYFQRKRIYDLFWRIAKRMKNKKLLFIFPHTQSSILKNLPSIMDITFYQTLEKEIAKKIIQKANKKFKKELQKLSKEYLEYTLFSTRFHYANVIRIKYGKFDPKLFKEETKEFFEKCLTRAKELNEKAFKLLYRKNSLKNLLKATELVFKRPQITFEKNFTGLYSLAPQKFLKGEKMMQTEVSTFLSECYPDLAAKIICFIAKNVEKHF